MLVQGIEVYGVGSVQRMYGENWPEMTYVCLSQGPMHDWLIDQGAHVELVEGLAQFRAPSSLAAIARLPRGLAQAKRDAARIHEMLKGRDIRIVHSHWRPHYMISAFLRRYGYRSIWHIHSGISSTRLWGLAKKLNHRLARRGADLIVGVSDFVSRDWEGSGVPRRTIRNAAPTMFDSPNELPEGGPLRTLVAGRLVSDKGHHVAVDAVIAARKAGSDVTLDLFGGPVENNAYVDDLQARVRAAGMEDAICFRGYSAELRQQQREYHLGLQCSEVRESCSMWVCEALVDGLPLLASASGGTPELVDDGVTGYLYRPGDVDELAQRLVELDRDREKLARMRPASFERGRQHFSVQRLLRETLEAYRWLAKSD